MVIIARVVEVPRVVAVVRVEAAGVKAVDVVREEVRVGVKVEVVEQRKVCSR